ncbi:MAG: hypothetical protein AMXMBFR78_30170 [Rubrivivax sp.]|nr:hypothetical protein [Burkholderiales bacterium]
MYQVTGDLAEVKALLADALTDQELAALQIEEKSAANPMAPHPRRAEPLSTTVLVWIGGAVATGMAYDVVKALSVKIWQVLEARYGADKVKKDESGG